jgi:membrane protein implicated in regulation of membrane protease activity
MEPWHLWIIVGVVLITLEMLTPGFFMALVGIAALFAGLGAKLGLSFVWQAALFVTGSAVLLAIVRPAARAWLYHRSDATPTNTNALIGKTGVVTEAGSGPSAARVKIGSEEWRAVTPDQSPLSCGAQVTVVRVDGSTLTVRVTL